MQGILLIFLVNFLPLAEVFASEEKEYSIIEKDHKKGLVNKKGRVLIPPEYEDLGWTNGGTRLLENVIGFKKGELWGVLNTKNERITEPIYTSLTRFNENWIVASKKMSYNSSIVYGIINAKGNAEVAFEYHGIIVHNDLLIASVHKDGSYQYGMLDDKAKPVIPIKYDRREPITGNLYEVISEAYVAVFNSEGDNLTDFSLDSVKVTQDNLVITYKNGKRGLIANDGGFIISPAYKTILVEGGVIKAQKFREWFTFDNTNKQLASYAYDEIVPKGKEIYKVSVGEAEALIHKSDSLITSFSNFEILEKFGDWISVKQESKYGVFHLDGRSFLEPIYDSVRYVNAIFVVKHKRGGKRGWSLVNIMVK